jgi:hypothetical protein
MTSDVGTVFAPPLTAKLRLFLRLIVRLVVLTPGDDSVYGIVITTGDQVVPAFGFRAAQVAPEGAELASQLYPHMGTICPSGNVVAVGAAVRLTVPADTADAKRRPAAATPAFDRVAFNIRERIVILLTLNSLR